MKFTPVKVQEFTVKPDSNLNAYVHRLARTVCNCQTDQDNTFYELQTYFQLARHTILYIRVIDTSLLFEINRLHPEIFGIHSDGHIFSGDAISWKNFLLSENTYNNLNIRRYVLPRIASNVPNVFINEQLEPNISNISSVAYATGRFAIQNIMVISDEDLQISDSMFSIYLELDNLEFLPANTITKFGFHTLMISADMYSLYPLARHLERFGVATLTSQDIDGLMTGLDWDDFYSPKMPAISEPWFDTDQNSPEYLVFKSAEEWYRDIRQRATPTVTMSCMPAMMQTNLIVTATEDQWKDILKYKFLPWSMINDRMGPFYKHIMKTCYEVLHESSNHRITLF